MVSMLEQLSRTNGEGLLCIKSESPVNEINELETAFNEMLGRN